MKLKFGKMERKRSSDEFLTKLLRIVLPIAFQQFMLALVSATDALMLGKLTQDSLSAVSLASQVVFVESLVLTAMTIGLSIFAAQYWGKNDVAAVERIFAYVMKITAAVSILFFAAAYFHKRACSHRRRGDISSHGVAVIRLVGRFANLSLYS